MRLGLVILSAMLVVGISRTASAERQTSPRGERYGAAATWAEPALEVALLGGWREREAQLDLGRPVSTQRETVEPGQELSLAVERMWSQVRAYRRTGGAELIVRGRF